jgi:hypothetical protein
VSEKAINCFFMMGREGCSIRYCCSLFGYTEPEKHTSDIIVKYAYNRKKMEMAGKDNGTERI